MNLSALLSQVLEVTSSFNPKIAAILFILCAIGEVGFALPYVLETMWLLAGYNVAQGTLHPLDLLYMWLIAQAGRQTGSLALYYSSMLGMIPIRKFYRKYIESRIPKKLTVPPSIAKSLSNPSPFSISMGRLIGLRIPMAVTMSVKQKLSTLVLAVLLSSIVWDGIYLILGSTVGGRIIPQAQSKYMVLYSLAGLTVLYVITLLIRYLWRFRSAKGKSANQI